MNFAIQKMPFSLSLQTCFRLLLSFCDVCEQPVDQVTCASRSSAPSQISLPKERNRIVATAQNQKWHALIADAWPS